MRKTFFAILLMSAVAVLPLLGGGMSKRVASGGQFVLSDTLLRVVSDDVELPYIVVNGCDTIGNDGYYYVTTDDAAAKCDDSALQNMMQEEMLAGRIDSVLAEAFSHMGKKYRMGRAGPNMFDCSGFTSYVFAKFDIALNRTSRGQYLQGEPVEKENLKRGDLVFFNGRRSSKGVGHVGIVVDRDSVNGGFNFIHASIKGVRVTNSEQEYYRVRYVGAKRVMFNEIAVKR